MSDDKVRVDFTISIGFPSAVQRGSFTIDRDEWASLTPAEREQHVNDCYQVEVENILDGGWDLANADLNDPVKED